jgi:hypothetical protein
MRYLTLSEFNNFKNSFHSVGKWIVAIHDLPEKLDCLQALLRRLASPELARVVIP